LPWTAFASTFADSETRLCASGLTGFGELAIGYDSATLPVANEPVPDAPLPSAFDVAVYPNPVRDTATISITLAKTEHIEARIYDLLGREVERLVDGVMPAGSHRLPLTTAGFSPGVYLVRIIAGDQAKTGRVAVIR
jgi:hypothetical protein